MASAESESKKLLNISGSKTNEVSEEDDMQNQFYGNDPRNPNKSSDLQIEEEVIGLRNT